MEARTRPLAFVADRGPSGYALYLRAGWAVAQSQQTRRRLEATIELTVRVQNELIGTRAFGPRARMW